MTGKIRKIAAGVRDRWQRPARFEPDWRVPLATGALLGTMVVFMIVFLEPWGTDRYRESWRLLRLSGYGLCVLIPFLLVHALDVALWRRRAARAVTAWRVADEVRSLVLAVFGIALASYLYLSWVINQSTPSAAGFVGWLLYIVLPTLVLTIPPATWIRRRLPGFLQRRRERAATVLIRGRNRDDCIRLRPGDFVCAEAQQNYVTLHYLEGGQGSSLMIRATLDEVARQLPDALRVHRSWLINPALIENIQGNARQRSLRMRGVSREIPVSPRLDPRQFDNIRVP